MTHPEQIPSEKITSFNFSFSNAPQAKKALEKDLEKVSERIIKIAKSEKFYINNFPVIQQILALSPSRSDLKKLSKALDRLADLVEVEQQLSKKMAVVEVVTESPNWITNEFGDFTKEIDQDLEELFKEL